MLPESIVMRAEVHIKNGVEIGEAIKLAFEEEERTLYLAAYGVDIKTGRMHKDVKDAIQKEMCSRVYNRLTNQPH